MKDGWFQRLVEVIERDPRSMREISIQAKCGENYVQQMIANKKAPGSERLDRLLEALGEDAALYVFRGMSFDAEDLRFLEALKSLSPEARAHGRQLFEAIANGQAPESVGLLPSPPKSE